MTAYQKSVTERKVLTAVNDPLDRLTRMSKEMAIIVRFQFLAENEKSRNGRFKVIANELKKLHEKLNFPFLKEKSLVRKIETLTNKYDNFLKYHNECAQIKFAKVFDITKTDGIWLANEGRQFYEIQIKSQGEVGYVTTVQVRVHPSKVVTQNASSSSLLSKNVASTIASNISTFSETSDNATSDCDYIVDSVESPSKLRKTWYDSCLQEFANNYQPWHRHPYTDSTCNI